MPAESAKQAPKLSTLFKTNPNISYTSAWRILRKPFPYRKKVANILTPADCVKRVAMAMPSMKKIGVSRGPQFSMVQWWKSFLFKWCCEQGELCSLGYWKARWSTTETSSPRKSHWVGRHDWPIWPIFRWEVQKRLNLCIGKEPLMEHII